MKTVTKRFRTITLLLLQLTAIFLIPKGVFAAELTEKEVYSRMKRIGFSADHNEALRAWAAEIASKGPLSMQTAQQLLNDLGKSIFEEMNFNSDYQILQAQSPYGRGVQMSEEEWHQRRLQIFREPPRALREKLEEAFSIMLRVDMRSSALVAAPRWLAGFMGLAVLWAGAVYYTDYHFGLANLQDAIHWLGVVPTAGIVGSGGAYAAAVRADRNRNYKIDYEILFKNFAEMFVDNKSALCQAALEGIQNHFVRQESRQESMTAEATGIRAQTDSIDNSEKESFGVPTPLSTLGKTMRTD